MLVHVGEHATHVAVLEGQVLLEHHVSRPSDDEVEIFGNIYLGAVRQVLPGMEAAFVDVGTSKDAVIYQRGMERYADDLLSEDSDGDDNDDDAKSANGRNTSARRGGRAPRLADALTAGQPLLCQVLKKPVAHKGALLSTGISLPGRFVVLMPGSDTSIGISRRISSKERRRLRSIIKKAVPAGFGVVVRTAASDVAPAELRRDIERLASQWQQITELAQRSTAPSLLYREPELALRLIREEFSTDIREVVIDDRDTYEQVRTYMEAIEGHSADRIRYYDVAEEGAPLLQRYRVTSQLTKALDRRVWLDSGAFLVIDRTEALTVVDVNTGRNVGKSSLKETILETNLEAADEVARQLRLRDIGGIIVIDFIDMDAQGDRDLLLRRFTDALSRDKTRTSVQPMSDLGIIHMTRRRIGEGLLETVSHPCEHCDSQGVQIDDDLADTRR